MLFMRKQFIYMNMKHVCIDINYYYINSL